jgi:DMSO/TMAO reductase YedYZ molybdopterin-dependent catalytic subunit
MERLPPGQILTQRFPILTYGEEPEVSREAWRFALSGLVARPLTLTYEELLALPQVELTRDFHCVTRWSRLDVAWKGVRVRDLLERARPKEEALDTTNLLLEDLLREDVILAHTLFGQPLPRERGGPVRLLVPHLYAWKSAKWVREIELLDHLELGFWERLGYHWRGDPWKEERFQEGPIPAASLRFRSRKEGP